MDIVPFRFQDVALREACWRDGKPYFTRRAIGEWLEYIDPQNAIDLIISRNPYISDNRWSTPVSLTGVEGGRNVRRTVRLFDPVGFQLIVFESRQPKAILFKVAVAHLTWAYMNGKLKPPKVVLNRDLISAGRQIHAMGPTLKRGDCMRDLAEREGCSLATIYRRIAQVTGKRLRDGIRSDCGSTRYPDEKKKVLDYIRSHPEAGGRIIRERLGLKVSESRICFWIREYRDGERKG